MFNRSKSSRETLTYPTLSAEHSWRSFPSLIQKFGLFAASLSQSRFSSLKPSNNPPWITGIAELLTQVKAVLDTVDPPLRYNFVTLSWPDFEADTGHIYKDGFKVACQLAGLEEHYSVSQIASRLALRELGVEDDYDTDDHVKDAFGGSASNDPRGGDLRILSITYTRASLGITMLSRRHGMIWPTHVSENYNHGFDASLIHKNPTIYWSDVEKYIENAIGTERIGNLIILGSHATDPQLLQLLTEIFGRKGSQNLIHQQEVERQPDYATRSLFAAARRAAKVARLGMMTGFDACLVPDECPRIKEMGEFDARKSEL